MSFYERVSPCTTTIRVSMQIGIMDRNLFPALNPPTRRDHSIHLLTNPYQQKKRLPAGHLTIPFNQVPCDRDPAVPYY